MEGIKEVVVIEPLNSLVFEGKAIPGKRVNSKLFGGFCECGGIMYQKAKFKKDKFGILVSECEKCWRNQALVLSVDGELVSKVDVKVIDRSSISDFIRNILSSSEYKALISKASGGKYSYPVFSKAKRKLESMGINVNDLLGFFR